MRAGARRLQAANAGGAGLRDQLAFSVRALAAAALAAVVVSGMLHGGLVGGRAAMTPPSAGAGALSRASRLELPAAAAGPVSRALGAGDSAYLVRRSGGALTASNPIQHLHTTFTTGGVSVDAGAAQVGLRVRAFGYGSTLAPVAAATPRATGDRVLYSRAGLGEWYANGPLGLEQGFTIEHAPNGRTAAPLTLSIALLTGAVLGGLGTLPGALWGSLVLVLLPSYLTNVGSSHGLSGAASSSVPIAAYGVVLIVVMLVFPAGIQGGLRRFFGPATAAPLTALRRRTPGSEHQEEGPI